MGESLHELRVLDGERPVEPPLLVEERDPLRRRLVPEDRPRRIPRHEVDQEEDEDRDPERDRHELDQPPQDIATEAHAVLPVAIRPLPEPHVL